MLFIVGGEGGGGLLFPHFSIRKKFTQLFDREILKGPLKDPNSGKLREKLLFFNNNHPEI